MKLNPITAAVKAALAYKRGQVRVSAGTKAARQVAADNQKTVEHVELTAQQQAHNRLVELRKQAKNKA